MDNSIFDEQASYEENELIGYLLKPNPDSNRKYKILGNTKTEIIVEDNENNELNSDIEIGFKYVIYDPAPKVLPFSNLTTIGSGIVSNVTKDTITNNSANWSLNQLIGAYVKPNKNSSTVLKIIANDQKSFKVEIKDLELLDFVSIGDEYIGFLAFDVIQILGNAYVDFKGILQADGIQLNKPTLVSGLLQGDHLILKNLPMLKIFSKGRLLLDSLSFHSVPEFSLDSGSFTIKGLMAIEVPLIQLINNSLITSSQQANGTPIEINLIIDDLMIDESSKIDGTGKGYWGGKSAGNQRLTGRTYSESMPQGSIEDGSRNSSGGSYGGVGGGKKSAESYGDSQLAELPGGGGASNNNNEKGGNGGTSISIQAANQVINNGNILSEGEWTETNTGAGAGGSIRIEADSLLGTGKISVEGGSTLGKKGSPGGGGRIKLNIDQPIPADLNISAKAGKKKKRKSDGQIVNRKKQGKHPATDGSVEGGDQ